MGRIKSKCDEVENRPFVVVYGTLCCSPINILLPVVPVALIVSHFTDASDSLIFALNFVAIIPLAAILSFATEALADRAGDTIGGLVNATLGNLVELVISVVALYKGQIRIVQASMLGSVLSNILLVLGCCLIVAGIFGGEQTFNPTAASTMSSLMTVACISLIIPAGLATVIAPAGSDKDSDVGALGSILFLSRGTSVILLFLYVCFLFFQLKTHKHLFNPKLLAQHKEPPVECNCTCQCQCQSGDQSETSNSVGNATSSAVTPAQAGAQDRGHTEEPTLSGWESIIVLATASIIITMSADFLVDSIDGVVSTGWMSKTFIGFILLPIVGNAAEHVSACFVAYKHRMDLALNVAIGSSIQIALFVTPFLVLVGWAIDQPMSLHFHLFETVVFFVSTLVVSFLISDGKTNYLEGIMCLGTYIILALAFWVYPDGPTSGSSPDLASNSPFQLL